MAVAKGTVSLHHDPMLPVSIGTVHAEVSMASELQALPGTEIMPSCVREYTQYSCALCDRVLYATLLVQGGLTYGEKIYF